MHPVCDRVNGYAGEHVPRNLTVTHGHTIHMARQVQSEVGHVQCTVQAAALPPQAIGQLIAQHFAHQFQRKLVVACRHGGVGCKHTMFPHRHAVDFIEGAQVRAAVAAFQQQVQGEQGRMPLVHVKNLQLVVAQGAKHADSADPQDCFLGQAIGSVSPVQMIGERTVFRRIVFQIRIQQQNGHVVSLGAEDAVAPSAQVYCAAKQLHLHAR